MHELAITKNVIDIVNSEAEKGGFERVLEISLRVGEYSGLIPDCIREFFPLAAKDTAAENAELKIETVPGRFLCLDCGYEGPADRINHCCPSCRGESLKMTAGREFYVESLKVE